MRNISLAFILKSTTFLGVWFGAWATTSLSQSTQVALGGTNLGLEVTGVSETIGPYSSYF